ncbi:hypothetical protein BSIN_0875 [Burkholderia singularis]|uniref:Uncharacterized protein n=1 Tax=Burkholderia singularis TaxID=1503053 RepID=A0A238HB22_9BURK|nr:hypothetical protein BSIN_0875 [Burkholderia singularis]
MHVSFSVFERICVARRARRAKTKCADPTKSPLMRRHQRAWCGTTAYRLRPAEYCRPSL